jgi:hypothetical protein
MRHHVRKLPDPARFAIVCADSTGVGHDEDGRTISDAVPGGSVAAYWSIGRIAGIFAWREGSHEVGLAGKRGQITSGKHDRLSRKHDRLS